MIYFFMLVKSAAWVLAFWMGIRAGGKAMLLWAGGLSLFLAVADNLWAAGRFPLAAVLVSLGLYALMSFFLFPLAWKLKDPAVSLACNVMGMLGAFTVVNFATVFLRAVFAF